MTKKQSLGRGLGALIPQAIPQTSVEEKRVEEVSPLREEGILKLPLDRIEAREDQPRKKFDEDSLNELKESIIEYGIIQPVVVRKVDDKYQIIAGERRFRAAKLAELEEIPVRVMEMDEKSIKEVALIENIQREDLDPIEEALGYAQLMEDYSYTQKEVSERLGKSRSYIANAIRLLGLDPEIKDALRDGLISPSQGRTLLSVKDKEDRLKYLEQFKSKSLNIRDVEDAVRSINEEKKPKKKKKNQKSSTDSIYKKDMEDRLISHLGTKVNIVEGKKRNYLEIDFITYDDLQRIIDIIER